MIPFVIEPWMVKAAIVLGICLALAAAAVWLATRDQVDL